MNKEINNNGYDYVDLGLPSGTLWATCNVGASKPSDFGLYFQLGDTQGYIADQIGNGDGQKKFALDGSDYNKNIYTKYNKPGVTLELEDDAAHIHMGGDWHMPTSEQIQELIDNTKGEWIKYDGIKGMKFTSKKDLSKFIFIPAAGEIGICIEQLGCIWSSEMSAYGFNYGKHLCFCYEDIYVGIGLRYSGFPIRGVIDKKQDVSKFKKENEAMEDKNNSLKAYDVKLPTS